MDSAELKTGKIYIYSRNGRRFTKSPVTCLGTMPAGTHAGEQAFYDGVTEKGYTEIIMTPAGAGSVMYLDENSIKKYIFETEDQDG